MTQAPAVREPAAGEDRPATIARQTVTWQAAPRLRRLATIAVAVVIAVVLTRHADLLLAGVPALAALAAARRGTRPEALDAAVTAAPSRCFEGEDVEVIATLATPMDEVTFRIEPGPAVELGEDPATQVVVAGQPARARWVLRPRAWGRHVIGTVTVECTDGVGQTSLVLRPAPVEVFPHPPPARATLLPADLLRRIGEHTAAAGAGTPRPAPGAAPGWSGPPRRCTRRSPCR